MLRTLRGSSSELFQLGSSEGSALRVQELLGNASDILFLAVHMLLSDLVEEHLQHDEPMFHTSTAGSPRCHPCRSSKLTWSRLEEKCSSALSRHGHAKVVQSGSSLLLVDADQVAPPACQECSDAVQLLDSSAGLE